MKLKLAIGAVLRTLRINRGKTQESLLDASSRPYVMGIEHGKSNISVEKLELISNGLGVSPLTFLALALSTSRGESTHELMAQAQAELDEFEASGGLNELSSQVKNGALVPRSPGRQIDQQRLEDVLKHKAEGLTQKMTSEKLGISKQTVSKLWKRDQN